jgi:hypothetical protein
MTLNTALILFGLVLCVVLIGLLYNKSTLDSCLDQFVREKMHSQSPYSQSPYSQSLDPQPEGGFPSLVVEGGAPNRDRAMGATLPTNPALLRVPRDTDTVRLATEFPPERMF